MAVFLKDYQPSFYLIDTVDLHFSFGPDDRVVVSSGLTVRVNPARPLFGEAAPGPLVLDGEGLELVSVTLDGRHLSPDSAEQAGDYSVSPVALTIHAVPIAFKLELVTKLAPRDNLALMGLFQSGTTICTQCEAEGFRRITYFLDRPDVMARFTTTLEADAARYPVLLANGNPVDGGVLPNGRHWRRWHDPHPKPCYLFALVAGNLVMVEDSFTTASGRTVALRVYVEPGNQHKCGHALRSLLRAMAWDERVFGLECDLDLFMIVAINDFNMGAMENKGLNIFNTKYVLASPDSATDSDFLAIESVVAHEYFHNWTGNRVTCRDWFQLSLKEGLTVFRDQEFSADMNSRAVRRIADVERLRSVQFAEDSGALAHPVRPDSYLEINNFYTATLYDKGAEVVRMIHTLLGPAGFRRGMDLYFQRHDGQAVTCDDFVTAMADASGTDLSSFLRWYSQAGTPHLEIIGQYDQPFRRYHLTVRQWCPPTPGQPDKHPLVIPLAVGLLGTDGRDLPLRLTGDEPAAPRTTRVLIINQSEQSFSFEDIDAPPVPSLLRGFSAPVRLKTPLTESELAFLLAHDSDPFNRWEAGQTLSSRLMLRLVTSYRRGRPLQVAQTFVDAMARVLADAQTDPAFAAKALSLPSESLLAQQMDQIDVEAIHLVRDFVRRRLAESLYDHWQSTYHAASVDEPFSLSAESIGRRALRNQCLATLMVLDTPEVQALAVSQVRAAATMTETISALAALADSSAVDRETLLEDFYQQWRHDPLVVNKWLAIQAGSSRPDTLLRVQSLLGHSGFDRRNPNKVHALIGSFGQTNQIGFHEAKGRGYAFLADQILTMDAFNAQVAARLAGPFARWRRFDPGRQKLMCRELNRILGTPGLSRDVTEIVSKSLNAA